MMSSRISPLRLGRAVLTLFAALMVSSLSGPGQSERSKTLTGRVIGVSDGDTIVVLDSSYQEHKVRLNGIDAPEMGQEFGRVAKESLARMVFGREVRISWQKRDRYDRILGRVFLGSADVNLTQLRSGMAWYYRAYESDVPSADRPTFARAEDEARGTNRGLWRSGKATPPWEYRASTRVGTGRAGPEGAATRTISAPPATGTPGRSFGAVRGNQNSGIYHLPDCPDYEKISLRNRVSFRTESEAKANGFRKARNCP